MTLLLLLYGWHHFKNPAAGLSPGVFKQAAELHLPHAPTPVTPTQALDGIQQTSTRTELSKDGTAPPISAVLINNRGSLDPFFAALSTLERHEHPSIVTILHYGDSPTTADLITGDARALLQQRFGDAGPGFNLIAKPWAWYGHRGVSISDHGWKFLTGVGSMRQGVYGLGGATLVGGSGSGSMLKLADHGQTSAELQYLAEPGGGTVTLSADGTSLRAISTDGPGDTPMAQRVTLPAGTGTLELSVVGAVKLLGIDLRKGESGLLYDSLGLNGASTTVISRTFAPEAWSAELRHASPALVIINYGTNESTFGAFVHQQYKGELRAAVAKLRAALPGVAILIMGPMDRGERGGLNEIHTMATIPEIIVIQQQVASELGCGFFDTFHAMGGNGTMARWYVSKPRLVTADLIHPTPQGALLVAQKLVENLDLGYDRWKQAHGIPALSGPQATTSTVDDSVGKAPFKTPGGAKDVRGRTATGKDPLPSSPPPLQPSAGSAHPSQ